MSDRVAIDGPEAGIVIHTSSSRPGIKIIQDGGGDAFQVFASDGVTKLSSLDSFGNGISRDANLFKALGVLSFAGFTPVDAGSLNPASQTNYALAHFLNVGETISNWQVHVLAAGGTPPSDMRLALWSAGATPTCVALSANLSSDPQWLSIGWSKFNLPTPYVVPASGIYYATLWQNGVWVSPNIFIESPTASNEKDAYASGSFRQGSLGVGKSTYALGDTASLAVLAGTVGFVLLG